MPESHRVHSFEPWGTTRAVVTRDDAPEFVWEPVEIERPRDDEILLRVVAAGICHTDVAAARGRLPVSKPVVLGHEAVGEVVAVGDGVRDFVAGQRVVTAYGSCGLCRSCVRGRMYACVNFRAVNFGARRPDGSSPLRDLCGKVVHGQFFGQSAFGEHCVVAARQVVAIPDDVPARVAAPLGCAALTGAGAILNALQVEPGDTVMVAGAGSVGLMAVAAARAAGASDVVAVDRVASRLALALQMGATRVIDVTNGDLSSSARPGDGFDVTLDTTGRQDVVSGLCAALVAGGRGGFVSFSGDARAISYDSLRGRTAMGIVAGNSVAHQLVPLLVDMWRTGVLPIEAMSTTYAAANLDHAIADMAAGDTIKPVIEMPRG